MLRNGASEITSGMSREEATLVTEAPGLARLPGGGTAASREVLVIVNLPRQSTGADANVPLRGVEEAAFAIRDRVEIVEGRRVESGKREIIVGRRAARAFAGLEVGSSLTLGKNVWEVVGARRAPWRSDPFFYHGRLAGMKVTIDPAGRVVVPKALRDALRLEGGTILEIRAREGRLELEPVALPMRLVRRGKSLVATTDEPLPKIGADEVRAVVESLRR